jgi:hypothetical protein
MKKNRLVVWPVQKTKMVLKIKLFMRHVLSIFYTNHKKKYIFQFNTWLWRCTCKTWIFFDHLKFIFSGGAYASGSQIKFPLLMVLIYLRHAHNLRPNHRFRLVARGWRGERWRRRCLAARWPSGFTLTAIGFIFFCTMKTVSLLMMLHAFKRIYWMYNSRYIYV